MEDFKKIKSHSKKPAKPYVFLNRALYTSLIIKLTFMKLFHKIFLVVPVFMLALACNKVNNDPGPNCGQPEPDSTTCASWAPASGLVSISGPATGTVGQTIHLNVVVTGNNGCAQQASVSALPLGNTMALTANVFYRGCICTQALVDLNSTYSFTPAQAGTYTFQGTTYEGAPVTHTVIVP